MADRVLRDHSQPCEHSEFYRFKIGYPELWCCRVADCPGGREVTIDYEAVVDHLLAGAPDGILDEMSREEWLKYAKPLVDAALPDLEV